MRKGIIKGGVFVVVFLATLLIVSGMLNKGNTDMTADMQPAQLPLVAVEIGGLSVNQMHGYLKEMNSSSMKECITPVGDDRRLSVRIDKYGQLIEKVSFQVRSVDGSRLVENTEVTGYEEKEDRIETDIVLKDLIEKGTEYNLIFLLELSDGKQVRYYTRIIQGDNYESEEKLSFAVQFSDSTFDPEKLNSLSTYMESNSLGDNSTLNKVTIHSSFAQVGWGNLNAERLTEPEIMIRDITEQTASIMLRYLVKYQESGEDTYADVSENFRVRVGNERMYLLDYNRTMEEIFRHSSTSFSGNKIMLGITGRDVEMKESDGGKVLAFCQAGALYSYNITDNKIARLYSFYDAGNTDARALYNGHSYKILQVDETGNVVFLVYGYINRGRHEGEVGIQAAFFNSSLNTVEELAFIPYDRSAGMLKAEIEKLSYVNGRNELYLMMDGTIYCVNLVDRSCTAVAEELKEGAYQASESNRMLVWLDGENQYAGDTLILMNLSSAEKTQIHAEEGNYVMPLGFMGEDLVYGVARASDVLEDSTGSMIFPMYEVRIQDEAGNVLMSKTYSEEGAYVVGCRMEENQIVLNRVIKTENGEYIPGEDDQIVSSLPENTGSNKIVTAVTELYETIVQIEVKNTIDAKKVKLQTPKEVMFEGSRDVYPPERRELSERYYVYGMNGVDGIYSNPKDAIGRAYEIGGAVTANSGAYVWRKERIHTKNQIMAIEGTGVTEEKDSLSVCLDSMMAYEGIQRNSDYLLSQGKTVLEILTENMEERQILDLTGCALDMILYYPDREIPVLSILNNGEAVLIIGFNEQFVVLMDPGTGTVYKKGLSESAQWFAENGNRFISYIQK